MRLAFFTMALCCFLLFKGLLQFTPVLRVNNLMSLFSSHFTFSLSRSFSFYLAIFILPLEYVMPAAWKSSRMLETQMKCYSGKWQTTNMTGNHGRWNFAINWRMNKRLVQIVSATHVTMSIDLCTHIPLHST